MASRTLPGEYRTRGDCTVTEDQLALVQYRMARAHEALDEVLGEPTCIHKVHPRILGCEALDNLRTAHLHREDSDLLLLAQSRMSNEVPKAPDAQYKFRSKQS